MNKKFKPSTGNLFFLLVMIYNIVLPFVIVRVEPLLSLLRGHSIAYIMFISQVISLFIPTLIYFIIKKPRFLDVIPLKKVSFKNLLYIIGVCVFCGPIMMMLNLVGQIFEKNKIQNEIVSLLNGKFLISIIAIAIVPAFFEEILMRGIVFSNYKKVSIHVAAIVNGLFFGILHQNMPQFFYAWLLGFLFVYLVHYTGSILSSMFAHFLINGTNYAFVALMNFIIKSQGSTFYDEINKTDNSVITIVKVLPYFFASLPCVVIVYIIMKSFIKHNLAETKKQNIETEIIFNEEQNIDTNTEKFIDIYFILIIIVAIITTYISVVYK